MGRGLILSGIPLPSCSGIFIEWQRLGPAAALAFHPAMLRCPARLAAAQKPQIVGGKRHR